MSPLWVWVRQRHRETNKSRRGPFGSAAAGGHRAQARLQGDSRREDPRSARNAGAGAVSQKAERAEPGWEGAPGRAARTHSCGAHNINNSCGKQPTATGNCIDTNLEDQVHTGKSKCHLLPSSDGDLLNK